MLILKCLLKKRSVSDRYNIRRASQKRSELTQITARPDLLEAANVVEVQQQLAEVAEEKDEYEQNENPRQFGLPLAGRVGGAL
jgi:3-deoxy-D-arabino-heptulosonate 7-phosphate (DAHP) synthase class II